MSQTNARVARVALERLLEVHAFALPAGFADRIEAFVGLLLETNRRMNLTRVVEPEPVARLHLLDSLSALPIIDPLAPRRACDLGSGGGLPGLVLAIARPGVRWTLVDSVRKKAEAMRSFVAALGLTNVEVVAERAEILGNDADHRETFDLVTARACAALPVLVEYALPLLRVGGSLVAWKGPITDKELRSGAAAAAALGGGEVAVRATGTDALGDQSFVVVSKMARTAGRYPRRPGVPAARPLG